MPGWSAGGAQAPRDFRGKGGLGLLDLVPGGLGGAGAGGAGAGDGGTEFGVDAGHGAGADAGGGGGGGGIEGAAVVEPGVSVGVVDGGWLWGVEL